jgi:hypothetical protein
MIFQHLLDYIEIVVVVVSIVVSIGIVADVVDNGAQPILEQQGTVYDTMVGNSTSKIIEVSESGGLLTSSFSDTDFDKMK